MKSLSSLSCIPALALTAAAFTGSALADDTATMSVTATVAPACQLQTVDTLAFGTVDPNIDNDASADITWVCTNGFNTVIELDGGASTDISARLMDSGTDTLAYQLYTDPARSLVFGDGGTGNTVPVNGAGYGIPATVTVYGRVTQAAAGGATGGNYTDVVNVTVLF